MPPNGIESPSPFQFLHAHIPQWLGCVNDIADKAARLQLEMANATSGSGHGSCKKKKTDSTESIRDNLAPASQRRLRTPSVGTGHATGSTKYRARLWVAVQYDGDIQKLFEKLVRELSSGRNLIRKAKLAAQVDAFSPVEAPGCQNGTDDGDTHNLLLSTSFRSSRGLASTRVRRRSPVAAHEADGMAKLLDTTDKTLEQVQKLCEKGAHRSLRDGDCSKELEGIRVHLHEAQLMSQQETARSSPKDEDKEPFSAESPVSADADAPTKPSTGQTSVSSAPPVPVLPKNTEIEVDPNAADDDWEMPTVPPIRLMSRMRAK